MSKKAPGRAEREGISMMELADMFPTEESAREWFEAKIWPDGRHCPKCGGVRTAESTHAKMPYWCPDCRSYFSAKTGSVMENSRLGYRKWVWAIYLHLTSLKGVSSMKLHRDIGVSQPTAWYMLQRIRKAFERDDDEPPFSGPAEVDETYFGGLRKNMGREKRAELTGRGAVGKTAVAGVKDRATGEVRTRVVERTDARTLQRFVREHVAPGATLYTDEAAAYRGMSEFDHETVVHSVGEYVAGMAHVNGMESFWSVLKRAHKGVYHKISPKHLHRYAADFAARHGVRGLDTIEQMAYAANAMVGKRLPYKALIADNGLPSGARS